MKTFVRFTTTAGTILSGKTLKAVGRHLDKETTVIGYCPNGNRHVFSLKFKLKRSGMKSKNATPLPSWTLEKITDCKGNHLPFVHREKVDWKRKFNEVYKALMRDINERLSQIKALEILIQEEKDASFIAGVKKELKKLNSKTFQMVYNHFLGWQSGYHTRIKNGIQINYRAEYEHLSNI